MERAWEYRNAVPSESAQRGSPTPPAPLRRATVRSRWWRSQPRGAQGIAFAYVAIGLAWITFSDRLVNGAFSDAAFRARAQTAKGTVFVLLSAALLLALIRRSERRLSALGAELRATVDGMADCVLVVDERGVIVEANRAAVTLVGASSKDEILGPLAEWGNRFHLRGRDGKPIAPREFAAMRVIAGEAVAQYEAVLRRSDGQEVFVSVAATPVPRPGKRPLAVSVVRDVTAARRVEDMREEFLATAAHEFKTPLAVVKAYAQLMSRREPGEARALAVIQRQVDRLTRLLEDILESSRVRADDAGGGVDRFDLAALARAQAERLRPAAPAHLLRVDADGEVPVLADRQRIERVVANLLENAVRFSPQGGEVRIRVEAAAGEARLSVADHGIGIPADRQDQVFRRYYRAHHGTPESDYSGLGLGLEVSRAVVEKHGGRMWFESAPGEGSTFHFGLPLPREERP
jgi:two-component system, OmpR family, phosphate regulon sensor histidine kinase PhoR